MGVITNWYGVGLVAEHDKLKMWHTDKSMCITLEAPRPCDSQGKSFKMSKEGATRTSQT